jgi:hypothetical protein
MRRHLVYRTREEMIDEGYTEEEIKDQLRDQEERPQRYKE